MKEKLDRFLVKKEHNIKQAMQIINENAEGFAVVADDNKRVLGVVTDGDIRRGIIGGKTPLDKIEKIMNPNPVTISEKKLTKEDFKSLFSGKIKFIVVTNEEKEIVDIIHKKELQHESGIKEKKICVIGLGYVGLTLAITLADVGFKVTGIEKDENIFARIAQGKSHFHEPRINTLLKQVLSGNLSVKKSINDLNADVYIISVGTPLDERNKPKLRYIIAASEEIGAVIKNKDLVILRSTVPIGTSRNIVVPIIEKISGLKAGRDFYLAMAPERTVEGKALEELRNLPQIVGGINWESTNLTSMIFRESTHMIVDVSSLEAAEAVKIVDNTYRDLTFAYANEMALLCEKLGLNAREIINAANRGYSRNSIPVPSPGVGGACLPKDPYILMEVANKLNFDMSLIRRAREINEGMPYNVVMKVKKYIKENHLEKASLKAFIIGFAFKGEPETSDTRDSPTIPVIEKLKETGIDIYGYDPVVPFIEIDKIGAKPVSLEDGFRDVDIVIIMNNHKSYQDMDINKLLKYGHKGLLFIDGWQIFEKAKIEEINNCRYRSVGYA